MIYCLNIADFIIKIEIKAKSKKTLIKYKNIIIKKFKEFVLINNKNNKYDYELLIYEKTDFFNLIKNKDTHYVFFFKKVNKRKIISFSYLDENLLMLIIKHILCELFSTHKGFILHGSANKINSNEAMLFLGKSGSGKSTISNLLNEKFPKIADDIVLVKKSGNSYFIHPLPFFEKSNRYSFFKKFFFIKYVFLIKKSPIIKIEKVKIEEIINRFFDNYFGQFFLFFKNKSSYKNMILFTKFAKKLNIFLLKFNKNKKELLNHFNNSLYYNQAEENN
ncbi:MAG: ATP-binding cassette domain-containing protein [Candidatus Dojkabacteria bacterium]|nr:ATP-binding cassette domain-containing protein [Candidatus Dojkabacteria bacterium]